MKKIIIFLSLVFGLRGLHAQIALDEIQPDAPYDNITTKKVCDDSLVTSTVIWVKNEVKLHKHAFHTEQVLVLEGTATMRIGEKWVEIKKGDLIVIPANTPHSVKVTSATPLKVLSIQSPEFDGSDRIMINE